MTVFTIKLGTGVPMWPGLPLLGIQCRYFLESPSEATSSRWLSFSSTISLHFLKSQKLDVRPSRKFGSFPVWGCSCSVLRTGFWHIELMPSVTVPVIPGFGRLQQGDHKFEDSLGHIV